MKGDGALPVLPSGLAGREREAAVGERADREHDVGDEGAEPEIDRTEHRRR